MGTTSTPVLALPEGTFELDEQQRQRLSDALNLANSWLLSWLGSERYLSVLQESFGSAGTPLETFAINGEALREQLLSGGLQINVALASHQVMGEWTLGAYAAGTADRSEQIYLNGDWINAGASAEAIARTLLEELGHAMDQRLNGGADAAGDEGELFAALVLNTPLSEADRTRLLTEDDHATLTLNGEQVAVELAAKALSSTTLGSPSTVQTLDRSKAASISLTVGYDNEATNGEDLLIGVFNGQTLVGWTIYNREAVLQAKSKGGGAGTVSLDFDLAQFGQDITSGGVSFRVWQGTARKDVTSLTITSGVSPKVHFGINKLDYEQIDVLQSTTGGITTSWSSTKVDVNVPTNAVTITDISDNTNAIGDFSTIYNSPITIKATLAEALGNGEFLEYSNDDGLSWSPVSSSNIVANAVTINDANIVDSTVVRLRVSDQANNKGPESSQDVLFNNPGSIGIQATSNNNTIYNLNFYQAWSGTPESNATNQNQWNEFKALTNFGGGSFTSRVDGAVGNNVYGELSIGANKYNGVISRQLKLTGDVQGYYFYEGTDFPLSKTDFDPTKKLFYLDLSGGLNIVGGLLYKTSSDLQLTPFTQVVVPIISVSSITVSESSPFAVVEVSLSTPSISNISFWPSLINGSATAGIDTGSTIEYFNGTIWVSTSSGVTIPAGQTSVLLRAAIVNDSILESTSPTLESLSVYTGNLTGVANPAGASGVITIKDDGSSGNRFDPGNNTPNPTQGTPDNDTPAPPPPTPLPTISVSSITVSESSPFAVVEVVLSAASASNITFWPSLLSGSAIVGTDTTNTPSGVPIEYFNGTIWVSTSSGVTIPAGQTSVLLRAAIVNDSILESTSPTLESLSVYTGNLTGVANPAGASGVITIKDDGSSGNRFDPGNNTPNPTQGTPDNDTPAPPPPTPLPTISVSSITVSESSPFAVVQVVLSAASASNITFWPSLLSGSAIVGTDTTNTPSGVPIEYFNGTIWVSTSSGVTIPAGQTSVLLRAAIVNDSILESTSPTLESLSVYTGNLTGVANPAGASGVITIKDDGSSGNRFDPGNNTPNPTQGTPDNDTPAPPPPTPLPTISVSSITVSESSPFAVVEVVLSAASASNITFWPSLLSGSAIVGTDTTNTPSGVPIEYFNGTIWVSTSSGVTIPAGQTSVLLRAAIVNDSILESTSPTLESLSVYTGNLTGVANPAGASGVITIKDDGSSGNRFDPGNNTPNPTQGTPDNDTPAPPPPTPLPTISVSSITVSESSPFAVVEVVLSAASASNITFWPSLLSGSAIVGTDTTNTPSGVPIEYFNGTIWVSTSSGVTIPAGQTSVLLRAAIVNDSILESTSPTLESLSVYTGNLTGVANPAGASGVITIKDDGSSGNRFDPGNNTPNPTQGTPDNDTPAPPPPTPLPTISVSSITVSESSPFAVVQVVLSAASASNITFWPSLLSGSAIVGTDTTNTPSGVPIEYFNGTIWVSTSSGVTIPAGQTSVLLRAAIVNDSILESTSPTLESLSVYTGNLTGVANPAGASGVITIKDDGSSGNRFDPGNNTPNPTQGTPDNDTPAPPPPTPLPTISVSSITVSESSPFAVVQVVLSAASASNITFWPSLLSGSAIVGTDTTNTPSGVPIEYFNGTIWVSTSSGVTIPAGQTSVLLRAAIVNDSILESTSPTLESLSVYTGNLTGVANPAGASGVITIKDDGSSGNRFDPGNNTPNPTQGTPDNDTPAPPPPTPLPTISVSSITVSESSPFAVVQVVLSAASASNITFWPSLLSGSAIVGTDTTNTPSGVPIEYFNGTIWVSTSSGVTIPAGQTSVLLRAAIVNDSILESTSPTLESLSVYTGNLTGVANPAGASGVITIKDDGSSGNRFDPGNNTPNPTQGTPDNDTPAPPPPTPLPTISVSSITVSESSPFAVVQVVLSAASASNITFWPSLLSGSAIVGTDTTNTPSGVPIEYFNGTIWVSTSSGVTIPAGQTSVLLRAAIVNDSILESTSPTLESLSVYTGNLTGVANPAGASGVITIKDDGSSGNRFDPGNNTPNPTQGTPDNDTPAPPPPTPLPTISVSSITVSESSPFAVVQVVLSAASASNITFWPSLLSGSAIVGTDTTNTPSGVPIEYFNGTIWVSTSSGVTIPAGQTSVLLRAAIVNDSILESTSPTLESLSVYTGNLTGVANPAGASGVITIKDDGSSGNRFDPGNNTPNPTQGTPDNDTPAPPPPTPLPTISVSSITVSESSPFAVVQVVLSAASATPIIFNPSLISNTATVGVDTGSTIEYFNGANWVPAGTGVTIPTGATSILLRTSIVNDTTFESTTPDRESFYFYTGLVTGVSNPAGASGVVIIKDDGSTPNTFPPLPNPSPIPTPGPPNNDQPTPIPDETVTVEGKIYKESCNYLYWTIKGGLEEEVTYLGLEGTPTDEADPDTDLEGDLEYQDSTGQWNPLEPDDTFNLDVAGQLLLRKAIKHGDDVGEGKEDFKLIIGYGVDQEASGTSSIVEICPDSGDRDGHHGRSGGIKIPSWNNFPYYRYGGVKNARKLNAGYRSKWHSGWGSDDHSSNHNGNTWDDCSCEEPSKSLLPSQGKDDDHDHHEGSDHHWDDHETNDISSASAVMSDAITAIPTGAPSKLFTGTAKRDRIVLGTANSPLYAQAGDSDYARITNFSSRDRLVLFGEAADYTLLTASTGERLLIYGIAGQNEDLIATLQGPGAAGLNLAAQASFL